MSASKGLQISLVGGAILVPSVAALLVLPALIGSIGMLVGGVLVWTGFIVTLANWYSSSGPDVGDD